MLQRLIVNETRPLFVEDVEPAKQALFLAIEELEYPDTVEVEGTQLFVRWLDEDRFGFMDLLPLLKTDGIELIAAFEVPDEPMASDDDEEDVGCFWVFVNSRYRSVGVRGAKGLLSHVAIERLTNIV